MTFSRITRVGAAPVRTLAALAATLTLVAGCAQVTVKKVPSPSQYDHWNDELQRSADKMEGVRFYMPRPFVNVFESFPIAADVFFVNGQVSGDGKYVFISDVRADSPLINLFASSLQPDGSYSMRVDASTVVIPSKEAVAGLQSALAEAAKTEPGAQLQDELKKLATDAQASADKAKASAQSARSDANRAEEAPATKGPAPTTGQNHRNVKNDNGAFAVQPLRGNFDVVYLPDFDEQYVVSSSSNLGNAEFQLNLGQGWSLQGFNSLTDNSEVNKRLFDLIDTSITVAKTAAGALIPGAGQAGAAATLLASLQSARAGGAGETGAQKIEPVNVTLKIVVLHYAAKGLYPVLKPRELLRQAPGVVVIDPFDSGPVARDVSDLRDPAVRDAIQRHAADSGRYTVPVYPYQYISFNTFSYAAVELVTTSGVPFGNLYSATGVTGSPGAARISDPTPPSSSANKPDKGAAPTIENAAKEMDRMLAGLLKDQDQLKDLGDAGVTFSSAIEGDESKRVLTVTMGSPQGEPAPLSQKHRDLLKAALSATASQLQLGGVFLNAPPASEQAEATLDEWERNTQPPGWDVKVTRGDNLSFTAKLQRPTAATDAQAEAAKADLTRRWNALLASQVPPPSEAGLNAGSLKFGD